jgi:hypothetical protein
MVRRSLDNVQDCPGSLTRPPGCDPGDLPLGFSVYPLPPTEASSNLSSGKAQELGTLRPTLDRHFTFSSWSPIGCPIRQEPTTTFRSSNGCSIFRSTKSARRFAAPWQGLRFFRSSSRAYPHLRLFAERFTLDSHRQPSNWRLHSAANLVPLPPSHCLYSLSGFTARCKMCCDICLTRPVVILFIGIPFEIPTSRIDLGLIICRVVTDLTPNFAFPPVPDSHPSCDGSC